MAEGLNGGAGHLEGIYPRLNEPSSDTSNQLWGGVEGRGVAPPPSPWGVAPTAEAMMG